MNVQVPRRPSPVPAGLQPSAPGRAELLLAQWSRGTAEILAAMKAMWADTHAKLSIDDKRVFASGFSGGARVSFWMSSLYPQNVAGVIAIGAGTSDGKVEPKGMAVWLMCGESDFNLKELEALDAKVEQLKKSGHRRVSRSSLIRYALSALDLAEIPRSVG